MVDGPNEAEVSGMKTRIAKDQYVTLQNLNRFVRRLETT
jgi:hypothetical protein